RLRDGEHAARREILRISAGARRTVGGNQEIVPVITTKQEDADQRLVVGGDGGIAGGDGVGDGGADQAQVPDAAGDAGGGQGRARAFPEEFAARLLILFALLLLDSSHAGHRIPRGSRVVGSITSKHQDLVTGSDR